MLAQGSPVFHSSGEGKLGAALSHCRVLKLNKVGKTTKPFRYDRNQIPYDYIVEVTNRFKGLDLVDRKCLKNYRWKSVIQYSR